MTKREHEWAKVRAIFEAAGAKDEAQRQDFVRMACKGDPALQHEVQALLRAAEDGDFLGRPPAALARQALEESGRRSHVGARVGAFRLVRRLGRGGMGEVYEAERADGTFDQRMAIKLIGTDIPTTELLRRFDRERKILASLNHPNIAHLVDGGASDLGPYLAMEFVDGDPVLQYCEERGLRTRARIELFVDVCDAVHFAHQKLIVHRDLKPSNVLVTVDGRPKLLDFGIASILDDHPESAAPLTRTGFRPMTPEYASPEQIRGEPITTSSDIYSLGVLLFELLTGERPYDLKGMSPASVERAVADRTAPRPSEARGVPDKVRDGLRGDLDTIVRKAMRGDPQRRYDSAAALAADLRRHLGHRPVLARPDTLAYRLTTFWRRHRAPVLAAALILMVVVAGSLTTSYQARRAENNLESTRALARSMLIDLNDALEDVPGATAVRAMLVSQALTYLDELSRDPAADRELLLEVADAYVQVGTLQGNPYYTNLGDIAASRTSYERALGIRADVWNQDNTDVRARLAVANSSRHLAVLTGAEGDLTESISMAQAALDLLEPLEPQESPNDDLREEAAKLRSLLGGNLVFAGQFDEGLNELALAITEMEAGAAKPPEDLGLMMDLWQAYANQIDGLRFSERFQPALDVLEQKACPMLSRLAETHPTRASVLFGVSECLDYVGMLQEHLNEPGVEQSYSRSLAAAEQLAELFPANERANEAVSSVLVSIGRFMFKIGRPDEGAPALERALSIRLLMREQNEENNRWTGLVSSVQRELCRGLVGARNPKAALNFCLGAVKNGEEFLAKRGGAGAIAHVTLAYALGHTARAYRDLAQTATDLRERRRLSATAGRYFDRSLAAYELAGDFGDNVAWEINPDSISAERRRLLSRGRPITD